MAFRFVQDRVMGAREADYRVGANFYSDRTVNATKVKGGVGAGVEACRLKQ